MKRLCSHSKVSVVFLSRHKKEKKKDKDKERSRDERERSTSKKKKSKDKEKERERKSESDKDVKVCLNIFLWVNLNSRDSQLHLKHVLCGLFYVLSWQSRSQGIMMKKNKATIVKKRKKRRKPLMPLLQSLRSPRRKGAANQGSPRSMEMIITKRIWIWVTEYAFAMKTIGHMHQCHSCVISLCCTCLIFQTRCIQL